MRTLIFSFALFMFSTVNIFAQTSTFEIKNIAFENETSNTATLTLSGGTMPYSAVVNGQNKVHTLSDSTITFCLGDLNQRRIIFTDASGSLITTVVKQPSAAYENVNNFDLSGSSVKVKHKQIVVSYPGSSTHILQIVDEKGTKIQQHVITGVKESTIDVSSLSKEAKYNLLLITGNNDVKMKVTTLAFITK